MHGLYAALDDTSLPVMAVWLAVLLLGGAVLGVLAGRFTKAGQQDKDASDMAAAALGLLALLIAFTYSEAVGRYDQRRAMVLQEANAIGSTANFALMLPKSDQDAILGPIRDYTQLRLNLGVPFGPGKLEQDIARSNQILSRLWQNAVAMTAANPQSLPLYRYVASLNETNNIAEARITALRNHVPVVVPLMLAVTAVIAMAFVGYSAAVGGRRRSVPIAVMGLLLVFLILVTQDLSRPDRGMITVSKQALGDALDALPAPPASLTPASPPAAAPGPAPPG